ncbi:UDP-2,3-diacylglucosamine diphosphatase LpxI [Pelagibacteraceae bacterium]|nr:UDP-2,3-diacylglucosamine diphosphatase LpxI [Pelagibacteraceae bacterium]
MIGLIFGETDFPKQILKKIKKKEKYIIIDLTKNRYFKKDKNSYGVSVGQFGKIIHILKENNCKKVLFAGKVNKPNFSKLKLDFKGIYYIPRIIKSSKLGDAAILKEIIKILKKEKISTVSSTTFTPELSLIKGNYSKIKPSIQDKLDINQSIKALNKTRAYSYSQGAVSRNNKVIAIEGKEGTKKMLKKIKNRGSGVLVKFPKKKQDFRIDLPTIGLNTFKQCKKAGLKGVILKHKKNIFLDKKKCIQYVNKNKMFILVK